ncbi:P-loop containing nucleoside triphosphate hydrolase protein [Histomonas meleagridis]|uniref:P-loop containing nucleoside triphosphate hydrolase protein n=1 Tax=Histomonas meleagridis TaxID=135588 RepID=UPI00355A65D7|nr:P-loop containing nucleoside triphosphate hydrolase protein [Histomonas meleagridis]KAH0799711.1 P-loop containing nucleoside triphosphate hydrolase protein [Histomonas meleagridis]
MADDPLDSFFEEALKEEQKSSITSIPKSSSDEELKIEDDPVAALFNPQPQIDEKKPVITPHLEEQLIPLHKNIYIPSKEIESLTPDEVDDLRLKIGNVTVHGLNVPAPIEKWTQCGLPSNIMTLLHNNQFRCPTAIQCQAIPCILSGRDVIGCAVTGSGKTLAFVLPCVQHILAQEPLRPNEAIAVFLSPTRELAIQTHLEASRYLKLLGLCSVCLVGGNDVEHQIKSLKNGAHLIVGTPGRFIDLMSSNKTFNLSRVGYFVIDEADRMFDLGFEPQVLRIASQLRTDRQSLMFSATFPHVVERCARKLLTNPIEIVVGIRNTVSKDVEQNIEIITNPETKFTRLLKLLGEYEDKGQALIFTNTQEKAEEVFGKLIQRGYKACLLHAGMDQTDRASIIHDFRQQRFNIMVLTSVGSRGLDIMSIVLVINYDAPNHEADYVHRLGRTGRAGNKGYAYTFIEKSEKLNAIEIASAMKRSKAEIPKELEALIKSSQNGNNSISGAPKRKLGFGGHGFRFDKNETMTFKEQRKQQIDNDDEIDDDDDEGGDDFDEMEENILKKKDGKFVAEFCINDFSVSIRQALTKKETIENVMDETGTTIIQRGMFCQPGSKPPTGERKLYLLIEGMTQFAVQAALQQLKDVAEGTDASRKAPNMKYKIN